MNILGAIIGVVVCGICASLLLAWPLMWFWNGIVAEALVIAKPVGYWTAFWLMFVVSMLLGVTSVPVKRD